MMYKLFNLIVIAYVITGCTDAELGKFKSYGQSSHVTCYSGGKLILDTKSSGKVFSEKTSDGYYFTEASTGDIIEVSADCIFRIKD